jgi:uncharacterized protein
MTAVERLHLLLYDYVPDVLERRAPHREAHLALLRRWQEDGRLVMAGAVGEPPHGAVVVLRVAGAEEARELVDADPYVDAGLVVSWRVEPWTIAV